MNRRECDTVNPSQTRGVSQNKVEATGAAIYISIRHCKLLVWPVCRQLRWGLSVKVEQSLNDSSRSQFNFWLSFNMIVSKEC